MPGGLALSLDGTPGVAMSAKDGHSRDVWVCSEEGAAMPHVTLMRRAGEVAHLLRTGIGLRSRIADNLYWLGRYGERADWIMRLMRGALTGPKTPELEAAEMAARRLWNSCSRRTCRQAPCPSLGRMRALSSKRSAF